MSVLYLESFENNLFELNLSISKKSCFYGQTLSGRWIIFARLWNIFSRFLLLSIYQNTSEIIRSCFRKKSDMSQQPYNPFEIIMTWWNSSPHQSNQNRNEKISKAVQVKCKIHRTYYKKQALNIQNVKQIPILQLLDLKVSQQHRCEQVDHRCSWPRVGKKPVEMVLCS